LSTGINPIFTSRITMNQLLSDDYFEQFYSAGLVSLILLSMDILSEATILNPYCVIVAWAFFSSASESITATPWRIKD
jgi:hypothetical protein